MVRDIRELAMERSGPELRQEDVEALEAVFGLTLPPDYLKFLSLVNGGIPRPDCYYYIDDTNEQDVFEGLVGVGELLPLTGDREEFGGIWRDTQKLHDFQAEFGRDTNVLAVGRDGSINIIYMNLSDTPPSVHILYVDNQMLDPKIADSFEQFIDGLTPYRDEP